MEGSEVKPQIESKNPQYKVIIPIGLAPRAARIANSVISGEIKSGERPEVLKPGTKEDAMGKFQTELNVGVANKRSVVSALTGEEFKDIVDRYEKLAVTEQDPLKVGEIKDVIRRLTEQFEEAKNPPVPPAEKPSALAGIKSWLKGRTEHGKFD